MSAKKNEKAEQSTFYDSDGALIGAHCYVKDEKGNVYYVTTSYQVIPEQGGAVLMLSNLLEDGEVTLLTPKEVLEYKKARSARFVRRTPDRSVKTDKPEEGKVPSKEDLYPVSLDIVLAAIPDEALANELRKRGYTLTASKPILICL